MAASGKGMDTASIIDLIGRTLYASEHICWIVTDASNTIVASNVCAQKLTKYREEELIGASIRILHVSDKKYEEFKIKVHEQIANDQDIHLEYPLRSKHGRRIYMSLSAQQLETKEHWLWTGIDISDRKKVEKELSYFKERLEYAIEGSKDVVWDWDIRHNRFEISARWEELTGYATDTLPHKLNQLTRLLHPDDRKKVLHVLHACLKGTSSYLDITYRLLHKNGNIVWISSRAVTLYNREQEPIRMVGTHRDITHSKELELYLMQHAQTIEEQRDQLWYRAHHDGLTQLPNRIYFHKLLESAIEEAETKQERISVMFVDLDKFKTINDTCGHEVGDEVLRHVAKMLKSGVRSDDVVARLGGDEFILIIRNIPERKVIDLVGQKLLNFFQKPYPFKQCELKLSISIGIALYPEDGTDADTLIRHADQAMYQVKQSGRGNWKSYDAMGGEESQEASSA